MRTLVTQDKADNFESPNPPGLFLSTEAALSLLAEQNNIPLLAPGAGD